MPSPIGAEDLYRFRWIDHVRLSRDGERVAYRLGWADAITRQNRSRIVVRRLLDQEPAEPTAAAFRDHSPEWSPDGRRIAFISKVGAADQLFVQDLVSGGEIRQLSNLPEGAAGPAWSPDGSKIAFTGAVLSDPDGVVDDPRPPDSRDQVRRAPVARVARRLDYKHDGLGYVDGRYVHLFFVPVAGGSVTQLTAGAWDVTGFDWSQDSTRLVVSGNSDPGADLQRELNLYLVDLSGGRHRLGGGFSLSSPAWSPRGDLIAFLAPNGLDAGLLERLWVVPLTGEGPRCLTANFDQAVNDTVITDMRAGHGTRMCWSAQGDRIYFCASGPGVTGVYSADLEGNVRQEIGGQRRVFDFDIASGVIAFAASDASNPGELHMLTEGAEARLTDLNPWLRDRYVAQPERQQFTAPDGWMIEGWLLKPQNLDTGKLHPLVLEVHGGPHGEYGWAFFHELQILAGMGYVVLYVNPRGSDGYGERFRREVVRDWGGKDFADLMSALDQVMERTGYIDTNRLGIAGGSYGGYMTNWAIGQTDRFSAAVSMRSISNLVSEYSQHDIVLWGVLELGSPPWPDLDELWKRSPIRYVQNIKTPLLLTCGEMDLRCAISQSEEMFGAMRLLGKTVELVRFPEESHDLSRNGRPDRRVERLRRITGWFERFLGTAALDRHREEATQVLPVLVSPTRELVAEPVSAAVSDTVVLEALPSADAVAEPEVVDTQVLETQVLAEPVAEIAVPVITEPDALPDLPEPEALLDVPEPEPVAASMIESEPLAVSTEPEAVIETGTESEPADTLVSEPAAWTEPEAVVETGTESEMADTLASEPAASTEPEPVIESGAESELADTVASEPGASTEPEPVIETGTESEGGAELAPAVAAEALPAPEPEPAPKIGEQRSDEIYATVPDTLVDSAPVEPEVEAMRGHVESQPEPPPTLGSQKPEEPVIDEPEAPSWPQPEPEPEPVIAVAEPPAEPEPEPAMAVEEPPAEPESVTSEAQAEPELQPEPVAQSTESQAAGQAAPEATAQPSNPDSVKATMLRWPGSTSPGIASPGNGAPSPQAETFEEATSLIPVWQQKDAPAESKRTVSLQALPTEEVAAGSGYAALLTFESGPFAGRIVALPNHMVTIGRAPDNDVVVGDPATSGRHGRIETRGGSFWIGDLGSTNGTLVNGEPVIEKQLSDGDLIAIGQNTIRFTLES